MVLTFPLGYHQGYNAGFNGASAVNVAVARWEGYEMKSWLCTCSQANTKWWPVMKKGLEELGICR